MREAGQLFSAFSEKRKKIERDFVKWHSTQVTRSVSEGEFVPEINGISLVGNSFFVRVWRGNSAVRLIQPLIESVGVLQTLLQFFNSIFPIAFGVSRLRKKFFAQVLGTDLMEFFKPKLEIGIGICGLRRGHL